MDGAADVARGDVIDAVADSPTDDVDATAMDSGSSADASLDANEDGDALDAGMGPECPPDDPIPPSEASTSTVSFVLTNTSSSDRWVLTQSTDCETFSIDGVVTSLAPWSGCGTTYPDERVLFQRLAPGASTSLVWDGRGLVLYTTYRSCGPSFAVCYGASNGAAQPLSPGQYAAEFLVSSGLQTGSGTPCIADGSSGDVSCTIASRGPGGSPQHGGQCTWSDTSLLRQSFTLPPSGTVTVNVGVP
jgi:hypothetical protein